MPQQPDEFSQFARKPAASAATPKDEFAQFARPAEPTPQPMPAGSFQTMKGGPVQQVSQVGAQPLTYATPGAAVSGARARAALPEFQQQLQQSKERAAEIAPEVGATLGMAGGPAGMGAGAAIGKAAVGMEPPSGAKPDVSKVAQEATMKGLETAATAQAFELLPGALSSLKGKLLGKVSPERIADLASLPTKAAKFQQDAWQAVKNARQMVTKAYPEVKAPVDVHEAADIARQAMQSILYRPEKEAAEFELLGKTAKIPRPVGDLPEGVLPPDLAAAIKQLDSSPVTTDFENAQRMNTALNEAIEGNRGKLTSDLYQSLKATQRSMKTALRTAAEADGKGDAYRAADKMFSRYMDDFFNPGAPLKKVLKSKPEHFAVHFNELMSPAKRAGITEAMERYGVSTADIKAVLARGDKTLRTDIADAARLKQLGPQVMQEQSKQAALKKLKGEVIKRGTQAIGAGGAYALYKKFGGAIAPTP